MFDRFADKRAVAWSKAIKERDNYKCRICKKYGISLHSHHIYSWNRFVEYRYDLNNGVCLCTNCHEMFHAIYGKGENIPSQFKQFVKTFETYQKYIEKYKDNQNVVEPPEEDELESDDS